MAVFVVSVYRQVWKRFRASKAWQPWSLVGKKISWGLRTSRRVVCWNIWMSSTRWLPPPMHWGLEFVFAWRQRFLDEALLLKILHKQFKMPSNSLLSRARFWRFQRAVFRRWLRQPLTSSSRTSGGGCGVLLMEKILHHQRCPKTIFQPHKKRVSGITSGAGFFHQPYLALAWFILDRRWHGFGHLDFVDLFFPLIIDRAVSHHVSFTSCCF